MALTTVTLTREMKDKARGKAFVAEKFLDPERGVYTAELDDVPPWSKMTRTVLPVAPDAPIFGIPKFWYKRTHHGDGSETIAVSDEWREGFELSPLHRDHSDGVGELDFVYTGYLPSVPHDCGIPTAKYEKYSPRAQETIKILFNVDFATWYQHQALAQQDML